MMDLLENQNSHHIHAFPRENRQNMFRYNRRNQNNIFANIFQRNALNFRRVIIHKDLHRLNEITRNLRLGLSVSERPPLEDFLETGLISDIVKILDPDDKINVDLQFELMWIISNACSGNEKQTSKIVTNRLIEKILRFTWHPEQKIVELALRVIANVSGDSNTLQNKLLQFNVLGTISKFVKKSKKYSIKENKEFISWILRNLSIITESHEQFFEQGLLKVVEEFLCLDDDKICSHACWTYSNMTNREDGRFIASILTPKFMSRIVKLLESKNMDILNPAIVTVGNILSSDSPYAIKMYSAGCLKKLEALIQHRKPNIRKDAIWAITNIVTEPAVIAEILERPLFSKLLNVIITDADSVKQEALYCFANALSVASENQAESIINLGQIKAFPAILSSNDQDIIMPGLEALENILHHGSQSGLPDNPYLFPLGLEGVIQLVEKLQNHPNNQIYRKVRRIIDTYFESVQDL